MMASNKKAITEENGSRVVVNHSLHVLPGVPNGRTCILDSLYALIGNLCIKQAVSSAFFKMMPTEGDTPMKTAKEILDEHDMAVQRATPTYQGGCMALNLLKLQKYRLVISIWLYDLKKPTWYAPHCVAWDGKTIHDRPLCVKVNNTSDRTLTNSKAVFEWLFHKKKYSRWQIVNVYKLMDRPSECKHCHIT